MFQCKVFSVNAPATQVTFYLGLPDLNWVEQIETGALEKLSGFLRNFHCQLHGFNLLYS